MSLVGKTLGQYRIVEFIGAGGMASVYKAYQASLDRHVAIKVLPAQHALTSGFKDRFILEARAVAQLSHPNILPIYDFGLEDDLSYFVMKYVPDRTLADLLGRSMVLTRVGHFVDQVAGALDHAHARGILHRDVKPANMLLEGDWLLLADFGMAKITESTTAITSSGHVFGTPAYVSPEQADGKPLDRRTDIYSLGVVLYEMVVGRVPYQDSTPMRVIFKHVYEEPPPPRSLKPNLSEAVEQVILKALAKNPVERYKRAGDLAKAFRQAVETVPARPAASTAAADPASTSPKRRTRKPTAAEPVNKKAKPPQPAMAAAAETLPPAPVAAVQPPLVPALKPSRPVSNFGLILVGGALLLLLIGLFTFFINSNEAEGLAAGSTTPVAATPTGMATSPTPADTSTPVLSTPTPPSVQPTATIPALAGPATPSPVAVIDGTLAIPVVADGEFRVYLTGFDGAGMNGPTPVSLSNARQPMFNRKDQTLVVNGTAPGAFGGIFKTDSQGLEPVPLNDKNVANWPVWSPDGTEIVFVDLDQNRTLLRQSSQLATSAADFSPVQANSVNLAGNNLLWSDDNQLVFQGCAAWLGQSGECGIWATAANTIDPVRITANTGLPTDARAGQITYMSAQDGDWEIYLVPMAGGQSTKLTNNNSQDGLAAIAPDGQSIAYLSNESGVWAVWTLNLGDQHKQKWFDLAPQRGTIDVNAWSEERMSWIP